MEEVAMGKKKTAAVILTLLLVALFVASSAGDAAATTRLQGEAGGGHGDHHGRVAKSVPAVDEGKGSGRSNCTHNSNQPKIGPCPPE
ncbi:unnamed protein product [Urochloa humidicola]